MSVLKIKDENGNWVGITTIQGEKGEAGDSAAHAHRHSIGGEDELKPKDIGASPIGHTHTSAEVGVDDMLIQEAVVRAQSAFNTANSASETATNALNVANTKAPAYSYGTADLEAGVSPLASGKLHFVYE